MEEFMTKMREYLKMDTEISFIEFKAYYDSLLKHLHSAYEEMTDEDQLAAKFILDIIDNNAKDRAQRKTQESKKYKKIVEKASLWSDAISLRLQKTGWTKEQIDAELDKIGTEN